MGYPVFLIGQPDEVGHVQGELQRPVLQERLERILRHAEKTNSVETLKTRAERLGAVIERATPHWLEEAGAIAQAADIELWYVLTMNCMPPNFWGEHYVPAPLIDVQTQEEVVNAYEAQGYEPLMGADCTTFFALGEATVSGEALFHKNRDHPDEVQCVYIKQIEGYNRFIGGQEIGNLGTAHLHTEDYWVGGNNTGSRVLPDEYEDCALNDCHVLRYLAERCASLDEIVPAMQELIAKNYLGGGGAQAGMIMLFADAQRGLIVEATSRRLFYEWFEADDAMAVRSNHFLLPEILEYATRGEPFDPFFILSAIYCPAAPLANGLARK